MATSAQRSDDAMAVEGSTAELTSLRLTEYSRPPRSQTGRCLTAQHTDREVVVYQAYKPELGEFAAEHNYFGGAYSFKRMSWIKPQFTWMMHRCGWATKKDQEVVLALHLRRDYWDSILSQAVISTYAAHKTLLQFDEKSSPAQESEHYWKCRARDSDVRLQWDPDHQPFTGHGTNYRVIQLGLRRDALAAFQGPAFGEGGIEDITAFVHATALKHGNGGERANVEGMLVPVEEPYEVRDSNVVKRLGLD